MTQLKQRLRHQRQKFDNNAPIGAERIFVGERIFTIILMAMALAAHTAAQTSEERACFDSINDLRAKAGLPPFIFSTELSEGCRLWSAKLRERGRLSHEMSMENCASGHESGTATFRQWYNSSGHRALLLRRGEAEAGVGADGVYWTFRVRAHARESVTSPGSVSDVPKAQKGRKSRVLLFRRFRRA
jgi:uncharacterized protein YkwD